MSAPEYMTDERAARLYDFDALEHGQAALEALRHEREEIVARLRRARIVPEGGPEDFRYLQGRADGLDRLGQIIRDAKSVLGRI